MRGTRGVRGTRGYPEFEGISGVRWMFGVIISGIPLVSGTRNVRGTRVSGVMVSGGERDGCPEYRKISVGVRTRVLVPGYVSKGVRVRRGWIRSVRRALCVCVWGGGGVIDVIVKY